MNKALILSLLLWGCGTQPQTQLQAQESQPQASAQQVQPAAQETPYETQAQMNVDACKEYKAADQKLNGLYQQVLKLYASDAVFLKAFKASQVAWLKYRDAHVEAMFPTQPGQEKRVTYGSVYPTCSCTTLAELTEARNQQLDVWVKGIAEGDVCSGSVRRKE